MRRAAAFCVLAVIAALAAPTAAQRQSGSERSTLQLVRSGVIALEQGNYKLAKERFREAAEIDPRLTQAHFGIGLASLADRDRRETERALRRALEISQGMPELLYAQGIAHFVFDDPREAEEELRAAAAADPLFLEAHYALGIVASLRGDLEAATAALGQAIRLDERHASTHYQLGAILARAGDLHGALEELSRAMNAAPGLLDAHPDEPFRFARRFVRPSARDGAELGMPLPVLFPSLTWSPDRSSTKGSSTEGGIPDWYLYYYMALHLEGSGHWRGVIDLLERALVLKDRSESLAIVANQLVDYSPYLHLAAAHHKLRHFRQAFLHLGIAKSEANASPEALRALEVVLRKDRMRPQIHLDRLPDRTFEETVTIRGVVVADEPAQRVEVAGHEAILRRANASEISTMLPDDGRNPPSRHGHRILFEVPQFRLGEGANMITIRPFFRNPSRDGDVVEVRIVRMPRPDSEPAPAKRGKR